MSKKVGGYRYVSTQFVNRLEGFPCAGPFPNITGMRIKYWGQDAFIIRCGNYAYNVDEKTFNASAYWGLN